MSKSTRRQQEVKPAKPHPDFPLFPHATKRWAKKIRGKLHYFGPWSDPQGALERYLEQKDDLLAGRAPRAKGGGPVVRDLLNRFLTAKKGLVSSGEILPQTFAEYHATCERIARAFGLTRLVDDLAADDFEQFRANMGKMWGPVRLANEIQRVRSVFKYGYEAGLIDRPVRFGPNFKKPRSKVLRQARAKTGRRIFEPDELRAVLDAAAVPMKTMILLGINCGFGNTDVATLPEQAVDLEAGWIDYPRPKTGVPRRCPLWSETIESLKESLSVRPIPRDDSHAPLLFITRYGRSFAAGQSHRRVAGETAKVLKRATISRGGVTQAVYRPGLSFYALRHTFQTIGDGARDPIAVQAIMGHAPHTSDMGAVYRESVDDNRLRAVTDHVRRWLFPPGARKSRIPLSEANIPVQ